MLKLSSIVLTLSLSAAALAETPSDRDDPQSGVFCNAVAVSSKGYEFRYLLHGYGHITGEGILVWEGDIKFKLHMLAPDGKVAKKLLDNVTPIDLDRGMGHVTYAVPGTVYGLTIDSAYTVHRIVVTHKISPTETLEAIGVCSMPD